MGLSGRKGRRDVMTVSLFCPGISLFRLGAQSFEIAGLSSRDAAQFSRNFMRLRNIQPLTVRHSYLIIVMLSWNNALILKHL
jgi:hypothetical protein